MRFGPFATPQQLDALERDLRAVIRRHDMPPRDVHDILMKLKGECSCLYIDGKPTRDLREAPAFSSLER